MGFNLLFGGGNITPSKPTYLPLQISVNTVLGWPLESNALSPIASELMDVTATAANLTLQFSDARQVSPGYTVAFNNVGANTFTVLDAQGNTLAAIASGQVWQLYLADNSTLQGTWRVFQYGAGVSSTNAGALAGLGLKAISTTLNERIVVAAQAASYTIQSSDRASCQEWTGGSGGVFTTPNPATVGSDWFCYIKNNGTGALTLTPAAGTIDGAASKTYNPNDSSILLTDGTNFFTLGFGQSVAAVFSFVQIAVTGGNLTLSGAQLNRVSYKFTGVLGSNQTITVPGSIQQYWIDNETTGAFTLTVTTGGGATQTVAQGSRNILYCDGTNILNAVTAGAGGITLVADGSAAAPGLAWASDTQMGLYKVAVDTLGFSTAGVARGSINASGNWSIAAPSSGTALSVASIGASSGVTVSATDLPAVILTANGVVSLSLRAWNAGSAGLVGTTTNHALNLRTNDTDRIIVGITGAVTINAPSSGTSLVVNANNASTGITATDGTVNALVSGFGGVQWNIGTTTNHPMTLGTNNAIRITIAAAGNVTIGAPTSGIAGKINGTDRILQLNDTGVTNALIQFTEAGTNKFSVGWGNGTSQFVIFDDAAGAYRLTLGTSGNFTINAPSSGTALLINGIAAGPTLTLQANGTSIFQAGGTASPVIQGYGPVAAALVDMTPDKSQWTTTLSGPYTANPTGTLKWARIGGFATIWCDAAITGIATGAAGITASGLPAAITPAANRIVPCAALEDNSVLGGLLGEVTVTTGGTLAITLMQTIAGVNPQSVQGGKSFTGAGTAGLLAGWSITYSL